MSVSKWIRGKPFLGALIFTFLATKFGHFWRGMVTFPDLRFHFHCTLYKNLKSGIPDLRFCLDRNKMQWTLLFPI